MVEKAYKFRFYPTPEPESLLRRTLGCLHSIYNKALATRTQAWYEKQDPVGDRQTSAMLTNWKKQENLEFLTEVSNVPRQQSSIHLQTAFSNFFSGCAKYPNFKKKLHGGSAEFTKSAFKWFDGQFYLAKCSQPLLIVDNYPKAVCLTLSQLNLNLQVDDLLSSIGKMSDQIDISGNY